MPSVVIALMMVAPGAWAVTMPVESTLATLPLLLTQATRLLVVESGNTVAYSCELSSTSRLICARFSLMLVAGTPSTMSIPIIVKKRPHT